MKRLATVPGGRRAKWFVLAGWLIIAMALGPLAGKVADVEDNNANAYLPGNAEAALVNDRLEEFRTDEVMPAVIVYVRDSGITTADRAKAEADRKKLTPLVPGGAIEGATPSKDGKALLLTVPVPYSDKFSDTVNAARDVAGEDVPTDLRVKVAAPPAHSRTPSTSSTSWTGRCCSEARSWSPCCFS